jgi:hypothetical protein
MAPREYEMKNFIDTCIYYLMYDAPAWFIGLFFASMMLTMFILFGAPE